MFYSVTGMEFCYGAANCYESFGRTLAKELSDPLTTTSPGQLHSEIGGQTPCYQLSYGSTPVTDVWVPSEAELLPVNCREIRLALALRPPGTKSFTTWQVVSPLISTLNSSEFFLLLRELEDGQATFLP